MICEKNTEAGFD